jgi:UDP-glucuronate decarboxylase
VTLIIGTIAVEASDMAQPAQDITLVAGGAGFIGSHLCRALLDRGQAVICIDNLRTSRPDNLRDLERRDGFQFVEADVVNALPEAVTAQENRIGRVYNLACAASPPHYQADPEHTMLTNVVGTRNLLQLCERTGARFLLSSTSEVYGDPEVHPQHESYRGWVNCTGRAPAMTRASAPPKQSPSIMPVSLAQRCAWRGSSTPMARTCIPTTAASSPT